MAQIVVTAGIDVSKLCLDVALYPTRAAIRVARNAAGLAELAAWLAEHRVERVGLEATGGYERMVMDRLADAGFVVVRLNPLVVRRFAEAKGRLAKNDTADARTIAQFTAVMLDDPRPGRRSDLDPLVEHLALRRQLSEWATQCDHQRASRRQKPAPAARDLAGRLGTPPGPVLEMTLARMIAARDDWSGLARRLRSVPGVGPVLA